MLHKLDIKAFFFNAKTDYLPYYKRFTFTLESEATVQELLARIQEANENFAYPQSNLVLKINGWVVEGAQTIGSLAQRLGTSWQIDPVSSYRSNHGLCINDADFMQSFSLLAPYATEKDAAYYESLYALHYASKTEMFVREYIGDAVLVLAHKMITEGSEHKVAILKTITSTESGLFDCEYENGLFEAQDHSKAIAELKAMVQEDDAPSLCTKLMQRFCKEKTPPKRVAQTIKNLSEKQVAHYYAHASHDAMHARITEKGIKGIHFASANKLCGLGILKDNKVLALKKAGAILLDAFDCGAEVLIVEDLGALEMFQKHFSAIEKTVGREIIGLELILAEDFIAQISRA